MNSDDDKSNKGAAESLNVGSQRLNSADDKSNEDAAKSIGKTS